MQFDMQRSRFSRMCSEGFPLISGGLGVVCVMSLSCSQAFAAVRERQNVIDTAVTVGQA